MKSDLFSNIMDLAVTIQQIPAPTLSEEQRAAFVHERFLDERLLDVSIDEISNVYGRIPGYGDKPPVVVSAHLDTVFPQSADLKVSYAEDKIFGPGIGDNSLGVASLFGLIWYLRGRAGRQNCNVDHIASDLPGDIWLVANVGEEGLGDLVGMRAVVDRFANHPAAYIVLEGMGLGQIYHRGLGVKRYQITAKAPGGHSWVDYGSPSAIHEIAAFIERLTSLPIPDEPRTTLNVGIIHGGTSVNTIAPEATLELDLRSENAQTLSSLISQVEMLVNESNLPEVEFSSEVIGDRPVGEISSDHPLIRLAKRSLKDAGVNPYLNIGSTDANIPLSRNLPAVCLGLTTGGGAHTLSEYINISHLEKGMRQLAAVIDGIFNTSYSAT